MFGGAPFASAVYAGVLRLGGGITISVAVAGGGAAGILAVREATVAAALAGGGDLAAVVGRNAVVQLSVAGGGPIGAPAIRAGSHGASVAAGGTLSANIVRTAVVAAQIAGGGALTFTSMAGSPFNIMTADIPAGRVVDGPAGAREIRAPAVATFTAAPIRKID